MPNTEFGITQVKLALVTEHAARDRQFRFTSLHHLLNKDFLRGCFHSLDKKKAVGIDGVTWEDYSKELEGNLDRLIQKIGRRGYKPLPSKRVYIPKNESEKRPLGISAVETKIVESAVTRILCSIYEVDFLPCSYGFRPGRNCHDALNALNKAIMFSPVNHIVEADIKGFFDNVSHERLMEFLQIRVGDTAMLELIGKFLKAGFIDQGEFNETNKGTPQGSILSPLLSNVFLHYTLDTWFENTVRMHVRGDVQLVRYADDFVIAVQYQDDARQIEKAVKSRFAKYGLVIHPEKSRIMSFGKYEKQNAIAQERKANTFDFLGFTHFCGKTRSGKFKLGYKTQRKKFAKTCKSMWEWLKATRSLVKAEDWWKTLRAKLHGHFNYYGISGNYLGIKRFYVKTLVMTRYWMNRRSQKKNLSVAKFQNYLQWHPLPKPEIKHAIYAY
jgi:group II intron reverse transcriptase/maturase